jgi:hypothetical protein
MINGSNIPKKELINGWTYYGDTLFIDECIYATNEQIRTTRTTMIGSCGKAYLITIKGINYIIKFLESLPIEVRRVEHEIEIAFELTTKIPDAVSNIKGACYKIILKRINTYLIFEGPKGMDLMTLSKSKNIKSHHHS